MAIVAGTIGAAQAHRILSWLERCRSDDYLDARALDLNGFLAVLAGIGAVRWLPN